jgi:hypothetical protein
MSRHVYTVQPLAGSSRRPRAPVRPRAIRSQSAPHVTGDLGSRATVSVSRESRLTSLPPLSWHMNGALRAKSYIRVQLRLARHGHGPTRCMDLAHHTRCITESRSDGAPGTARRERRATRPQRHKRRCGAAIKQPATCRRRHRHLRQRIARSRQCDVEGRSVQPSRLSVQCAPCRWLQQPRPTEGRSSRGRGI